MHYHRRHGWEILENRITPEALVLNRRAVIAGLGGTAAASIAGPALAQRAEQAADPSASLYPAPRDARFDPGRPITPEQIATTYNNFYEFGSHKQIWRAAQALPIRPWQIRIDGMVEQPMTLGVDDLLRRVRLEERVYRLRCVEAWAATIPWTGFTMRQLVEIAKPTSGARYLRFETFQNAQVASGQRQFWYPWPYVEGITMAEAMNELTMMVTGAYGKPLPRQMGAPIRFIVPWKYGFKSGKSITRITFTDQRPKSFWETIQAAEYGFWANVNPEVAHPRWSQATERLLDDGSRVPTLLFNGYGQWVADLYRGLPASERLWS
jgi:methionine sulfoxide reductase catalytic subunit